MEEHGRAAADTGVVEAVPVADNLWQRLLTCQLATDPYQGRSRVDAELRIRVGQMGLDGSVADVQPSADFRGHVPLRGQLGDLELSPGQRLNTVRGAVDSSQRARCGCPRLDGPVVTTRLEKVGQTRRVQPERDTDHQTGSADI